MPSQHKEIPPYVELITFNDQLQDSWNELPFADYTFWTFPCKNEAITDLFLKKKRYLLGKIIGIGTTSIYLNPKIKKQETKWIDENSPKQNSSHTRWNIEKKIIKCGATWGLSAGIYHSLSYPSDWMRYARVHPENWVNLIHVDDLAKILLRLAHHAPSGEIFNISDGHPYQWKTLAEYFLEKKYITQEFFDEFMARSRHSPSQPSGKKISNQKILPYLDFSLKSIKNRPSSLYRRDKKDREQYQTYLERKNQQTNANIRSTRTETR